MTSVFAQDRGCNLKKSFAAPVEMKFVLANKYGDISVITSNTDSLIICATINIDQENKDIASKSTRLINFDISETKDSVSITTVFDKEFFTPKFSTGRRRFSVDYTITAPVYISMYLNNSFGNITLDENSGYLNIRLSQGILTAKKLNRGDTRPLNYIYAFHSEVNLQNVNWLELTTRNCNTVNILYAQALLINSGFSKLSIEKVNSLVANAKSDSYDIGSISNLQSENSYSTFNIKSLDGLMVLKTIFGSVNVSLLKKGFSKIDILSNHTPVTLNTGEGVSFKADITAVNNPVDFRFENDPGITMTIKNSASRITGVAGPDKQTSSIIKINTTLGKLEIK